MANADPAGKGEPHISLQRLGEHGTAAHLDYVLVMWDGQEQGWGSSLYYTGAGFSHLEGGRATGNTCLSGYESFFLLLGQGWSHETCRAKSAMP